MKKFLAMALAAVMVLALAACGSKNDTADDTGDAQDAQGGETQKLIVGFDAEFPPFGFIAADGTYDGFDLAMAKELCARLGIPMSMLPVPVPSSSVKRKSFLLFFTASQALTLTARKSDLQKVSKSTFSSTIGSNSIAGRAAFFCAS